MGCKIEICEDKKIVVKNIGPAEADPYVTMMLKSYHTTLRGKKISLDELNTILSSILSVSHSKYGDISIKNFMGEKNIIERIATQGETSTNADFNSELSERSIINEIIVISTDVQKDERFKNHSKIKSFLAFPLFWKNVCIGQLALANSNRFSEKLVQKIRPLLPLVARMAKKYKSGNVEKTRDNTPKTTGRSFIENMSHELKTPLNGMMGCVDLLKQTDMTAKQKDYVRIMSNCVYQLLTLINNILDFSKMRSGTLNMTLRPYNIREAIDTSVKIARSMANGKNIEIKSSVSKFVPATVVGEQQRLIQVLNNLMSNSVKYTQNGTISLRVEAKKIETKWTLTFKIHDTGAGIPIEHQNKIFDPFYQIPNLTAEKGVGLGLSIAKELVTMMGGNIVVKSDGENKGTKFCFTICVDEEFIIPADSLKGKKFLIVDDREEIRLHLTELVFRWGGSCIAATSAREALYYINYNTPFDIALLDIVMPQMSGIELAQEIRFKRPELPIIGISSISSPKTDLFDEMLYKPINPKQIYESIWKCLMTINTRKRAFSVAKLKKDVNVLVAEDDPGNAYVMKELLASLGFNHITVVTDGERCVNEAQKCQYDVVIVDVLMPKMSGLEAAKKIRGLCSNIVIIAISAATEFTSEYNSYLDGYLSKPTTKERVRDLLNMFVSDN